MSLDKWTKLYLWWFGLCLAAIGLVVFLHVACGSGSWWMWCQSG